MSVRYDLKNQAPEKMHRAEYACDDNWIRSFLAQAVTGHVATRWDEQPFITPVLFWYDTQSHEIYFHTNVTGRLQANCQRHPEVCFETFRAGELLPADIALEFSIQYESVVVFGEIRQIDQPDQMRAALYGLIEKYFPAMQPGVDYQPITDPELKRTAVFAIAVESWSGKRNWSESV
ncbi:MAG: pyridoxamine 5'-phosphate oxidase family protein [Anaerolineales bacterium]|nr:pyridoxamine 5'-phosphate oxidase family protein [Anaerolineales bacterium]